MKRLWANRWCRLASALLSLIAVGVLAGCWRYGIWSYKDYCTYMEVRRYPIGDELWFGRIQAGQDADALAAQHPPRRAHRAGRFVDLQYVVGVPDDGVFYLESLTVVAKDGRLVQAAAGGCTWGRVFFRMSDDEEAEYSQTWEQYFRERGLLPQK
jgi:hypothetical protein